MTTTANSTNQDDSNNLIDPVTGQPLNSEVLEASQLPSEINGLGDNPGASETDIVDLNGTAKGDVELTDDAEANLDPINNDNAGPSSLNE